MQEDRPAEKNRITTASRTTTSRTVLWAAANWAAARMICPVAERTFRVCCAVFCASLAAWAYLRLSFCFCIHLDRVDFDRSSGFSRREACHARFACSFARRRSADRTSRYGLLWSRWRFQRRKRPAPRSARNSPLWVASTATLSRSTSRIFVWALKTAAFFRVLPAAFPARLGREGDSYSGIISVSNCNRRRVRPASLSYRFSNVIRRRVGSFAWAFSNFRPDFSTRRWAFS